MLTIRTFQREVGGRNLIIETGKLGQQASAAVTVKYGETVVLVTLGMGSEPREGVDFLPLTIDYEERLYAAGKIPGGFIRREGRPSEQATLASRLVDRPLRPLLPKSWRHDIQIINTVLSADQENDPDVLAVIGGSAVLAMSEIPFAGPVGAIRVGYVNNEMVLNPTLPQLENSQLDLVVVSTKEAVVMIEAGAKEVSEEIVLRAIELAHEANQKIVGLLEEIRLACGRPKVAAPAYEPAPEVVAAVAPLLEGKLEEALYQPDKPQRQQALDALRQEVVAKLSESFPKEDIKSAFETRVRAEIRGNVLNKAQRVSRRAMDEIRPLECEVGLLPRTHGSGLFSRGLTQVLTITTLGSKSMEQQLDGLGIEETKRFIHHYNFPPFSTGEVKRIGVPGRREVGHGALAERALLPVIPSEEVFPYTMRLVSEVLSSNGSTSMGSTCASSLSLMDAGVPIKTAVAGIAMGLVTDESGRYAILTDLEGIEDNYGDMDFKVAGTAQGVTAMQLDIKIKGLTMEIIRNAVQQAKTARFRVLEAMNKVISSPRAEVSKYAPRMYKISIDPDKIGAVIGTGGKTVRAIASETNTTIDIENDGTVIVGATDEASARKAIAMIEGITKEAKVGEIYTGKVTRILNFGAMVEYLPNREGLVHISELADHRVGKVEDVVKVGDELTVKVVDIDSMGRVNLSRRALLEPEGAAGEPRRPPSRPPQRPGPVRSRGRY
ncbi:MAG: polyribonucleotide nucleotidyltransferase [Chloroflexi bacterium]|nr:polyribonucleotide nucleotidyltransferase [Chloroflexota bacterium]